jgi:hypothetical protein
MDYVARAAEAARQWREGQAPRDAAEVIPDFSLISLSEATAKPRPETHSHSLSGKGTPPKKEKKGEKESAGRERSSRSLLVVGDAVYALDPRTVRGLLGPEPDPHALGCLKLDVAEALTAYLDGVRAGVLPPRRLVHGLPLADVLDLDDVARLLRHGMSTLTEPHIVDNNLKEEEES